jgi:hypothetical protein
LHQVTEGCCHAGARHAISDLKQDVAAHYVSHRLETAEKHYKFTDKQNSYVQLSNGLCQVLPQPSATAVFKEAHPSETSRETCTANSPLQMAKATPQGGMQQTIDSSSITHSSDDDRRWKWGTIQETFVWKDDDRDMVKHKFADIISSEKKTSLRKLRKC